MSERSRELVLDLARSQLASQKDDLRAFRNQAGFMSATTGIVAAVFARFSATLELWPLKGEVGVFGLGLEPLLVFTCFALSIMFAIRAVIVWHSVEFDQNIKDLNQRITGGETRAALLINLSNDLDRCVVANEKKIDTIKIDLWWSGVLCFVQILAWLLWLS